MTTESHHPGPQRPALLTQPPRGASAWVEIDVAAIATNVRELRRRSSSAQLMAVVKADAYGHGVDVAARAALAGGAQWLGVAQLSEAIELRDSGIDAPLLSWIYPPEADLATAIRRDITLGIGARAHLASVARAARAVGRAATVHLKVDTGLGRGGVLEDLDAVLDDLAPMLAEGALTMGGTWSHFAFADAPDHPTVRAQQERFGEVLRLMEARGIPTGVAHLANSAATLTNPSAHFDMVRPGLAIYGLSPVPDLGRPEDFGLREAMRVRARLTTVKRARPVRACRMRTSTSPIAIPSWASSRWGMPTACLARRVRRGRCVWASARSPWPGGSAWTSSSSISVPTSTEPRGMS